jgi:RhoGEF domain
MMVGGAGKKKKKESTKPFVILEAEHIDAVFSNVEELLAVHLQLLERLVALRGTTGSYELVGDVVVPARDAGASVGVEAESAASGEPGLKKDCAPIGELFVEFGPALKAYTTFINNYNRSMEVLIAQRQRNKEFDRYVLVTRCRPQPIWCLFVLS